MPMRRRVHRAQKRRPDWSRGCIRERLERSVAVGPTGEGVAVVAVVRIRAGTRAERPVEPIADPGRHARTRAARSAAPRKVAHAPRKFFPRLTDARVASKSDANNRRRPVRAARGGLRDVGARFGDGDGARVSSKRERARTRGVACLGDAHPRAPHASGARWAIWEEGTFKNGIRGESRDPAVVSGHPRGVESNPRAIPPRVEDSDLLAGDVAVLWLFALTQKTASVALSSSFPGWLAPVAVNPASAASFLGESTWLIATWIAVNAVIGGYELDPLRLGKEEGEMREAVKGAAVAWAAWCVPAFGGLTWFEKATGLSPSFPVGVTLGTALGVMIAWRAFVKVVGLMGWWREGRVRSAKEEEDWSLLFQSLGGATAVAFAAAVADFVGSGGMDRGGMDAW